MAKYDVYPSPGGVGFVVDVQTDLLDGLSTRVVAPLLPAGSAPIPAKLLNPMFEIGGEAHVLVTQFLAAVPAQPLREPVANLHERADEVTRALDMLFQGF
jgi:toxin CcdB